MVEKQVSLHSMNSILTKEEERFMEEGEESRRYFVEFLEKRGLKGSWFGRKPPKVEPRWFVLDRKLLTLTYDHEKPDMEKYDAIGGRHRKLIDLRTIKKISYADRKGRPEHSDGWFKLQVSGRTYNIRVNHHLGTKKPLQFVVGTIKRAVHKWFSSALLDKVVEAGYLDRRVNESYRAAESKTQSYINKVDKDKSGNTELRRNLSRSVGEWHGEFQKCFSHLTLTHLTLCSEVFEVKFDFFGDMEAPLELPVGVADFVVHTPKTAYRFRATHKDAQKWHKGISQALRDWGMVKHTMSIMKAGSYNKDQWSRRMLQLTRSHLRFNKKSDLGKCYEIPLDKIVRCGLVPSHRNEFFVRAPSLKGYLKNTTLQFRCTTEDDAASWVSSINRCVEEATKSTEEKSNGKKGSNVGNKNSKTGPESSIFMNALRGANPLVYDGSKNDDDGICENTSALAQMEATDGALGYYMMGMIATDCMHREGAVDVRSTKGSGLSNWKRPFVAIAKDRMIIVDFSKRNVLPLELEDVSLLVDQNEDATSSIRIFYNPPEVRKTQSGGWHLTRRVRLSEKPLQVELRAQEGSASRLVARTWRGVIDQALDVGKKVAAIERLLSKAQEGSSSFYASAEAFAAAKKELDVPTGNSILVLRARELAIRGETFDTIWKKIQAEYREMSEILDKRGTAADIKQEEAVDKFIENSDSAVSEMTKYMKDARKYLHHVDQKADVSKAEARLKDAEQAVREAVEECMNPPALIAAGRRLALEKNMRPSVITAVLKAKFGEEEFEKHEPQLQRELMCLLDHGRHKALPTDKELRQELQKVENLLATELLHCIGAVTKAVIDPAPDASAHMPFGACHLANSLGESVAKQIAQNFVQHVLLEYNTKFGMGEGNELKHVPRRYKWFARIMTRIRNDDTEEELFEESWKVPLLFTRAFCSATKMHLQMSTESYSQIALTSKKKLNAKIFMQAVLATREFEEKMDRKFATDIAFEEKSDIEAGLDETVVSQGSRRFDDKISRAFERLFADQAEHVVNEIRDYVNSLPGSHAGHIRDDELKVNLDLKMYYDSRELFNRIINTVQFTSKMSAGEAMVRMVQGMAETCSGYAEVLRARLPKKDTHLLHELLLGDEADPAVDPLRECGGHVIVTLNSAQYCADQLYILSEQLVEDDLVGDDFVEHVDGLLDPAISAFRKLLQDGIGLVVDCVNSRILGSVTVADRSRENGEGRLALRYNVMRDPFDTRQFELMRKLKKTLEDEVISIKLYLSSPGSRDKMLYAAFCDRIAATVVPLLTKCLLRDCSPMTPEGLERCATDVVELKETFLHLHEMDHRVISDEIREEYNTFYKHRDTNFFRTFVAKKWSHIEKLLKCCLAPEGDIEKVCEEIFGKDDLNRQILDDVVCLRGLSEKETSQLAETMHLQNADELCQIVVYPGRDLTTFLLSVGTNGYFYILEKSEKDLKNFDAVLANKYPPGMLGIRRLPPPEKAGFMAMHFHQDEVVKRRAAKVQNWLVCILKSFVGEVFEFLETSTLNLKVHYIPPEGTEIFVSTTEERRRVVSDTFVVHVTFQNQSWFRKFQRGKLGAFRRKLLQECSEAGINTSGIPESTTLGDSLVSLAKKRQAFFNFVCSTGEMRKLKCVIQYLGLDELKTA
eukprot:g4746.t1